jgi:SAM-dependent methyltransferase
MNATAAAIWHDVECGGYRADLPLWEELAERRGGPLVELGCGTGRVAMHLSARGYRVYGVDLDPDLLATLAARAGDLEVEPIVADGRDFELPEPVSLALAPMQFLQLLPSGADLQLCLESVAAALRPGGLLAAAIVESLPPSDSALLPLPDVREIDGWVYSSLPVAAATTDGRIVLRRLRQTVSPSGELRDEEDEIQLRALSAEDLEIAAVAAGFTPAGRRVIPETEAHVGSLVVLLQRSS